MYRTHVVSGPPADAARHEASRGPRPARHASGDAPAAVVRDRIVRAAEAYAGTPTGDLVRKGTACAAALNVVLARVFGHAFGADPDYVPEVRAGLQASGEWQRTTHAAPGDIAVENGRHLSRSKDDPYEGHIGIVVPGAHGSLRTISNGDHFLRHGTTAGFGHLDDLEYGGLHASGSQGPSAFYHYVGRGGGTGGA